MCAPLAALAAPLLIASTAVTAVGGIVAAKGQADQANYAAGIADTNTRLANEQARDSITNTNLEAQRRYRQQAQLKGQQTAAMAANGVDLDFGSARDVARDTAMIGAEDVGQIYKGGNERTKGYEINAFNYRSDAAANRAKADGAITTGIFGALGTALGGASQLAKMRKPVG